MPRGFKKPETPTKPAGFFAHVANLWREHRTAVAGVLMGATVLPNLVGCTSMVREAQAATPDANFDAFRAKADALNQKRGTIPHAELNTEREKLFAEYAKAGGRMTAKIDADKDGLSLAREVLFGTSDSKVDSDGDQMSDGFEVKSGFDPADAQLHGAATNKAWTHGYIPMSRNPMVDENTLFFYDLLVQTRTGTDPQLRHIEGRSALDGGHYFLSSTLSEKDAELTAAHDFNGDGVLTPNVEHDFLKPGSGESDFGADGKKETTLSVGWWGHCNDVSTAGINFREPKANVTFDLPKPVKLYSVSTSHGTFKAESVTKGATHTDIKLLSGQTVRLPNADVTSTQTETITKLEFTPRMLKELASELVHRGSALGSEFHGSRFYGREATITLTDGSVLNGGLSSSLEDRADVSGEGMLVAKNFTKDVTVRVFDFSTSSYVDRTLKPSEIKEIQAENQREVGAVDFHRIMLTWIGSEGKAGVMDKDSGPHVWNYAFDRYDLKSTPKDGGKVEYEMDVFFAANSYPSKYTYEITYKNGEPVSGKWADGSPNPDFFWRDKGGAEGFNHEHAGEATPLDFKTVMELLNKSYAAEDGAGNSGSTNHNNPN